MSLKTVSLILLVIFIWGSNFVAIKAGVMAIDPLVLLAMRFTLAGLIFIPFMKWPGWKKASMIMLVGFLMGPLHQGLLYFALTVMPAGLMSVLLQSNVIMVTLIGWLFLKEKVGWRTWSGILVGILGVAVLVGIPDPSATGTGYALALLSAFFIALAYIAMKQLHVVHPPTYIALMSLPVAPFIMLSSYVVEGTDWLNHLDTIDWKIVGGVVFYQAIILSLSHMVWQRLMTQMPVSQIIPWTLLIPVAAMGAAILILGETLTPSILVGGLLTISGVGIVTLRRIQKKQTAPIEGNLD
ncbi:MAG TPA: EamA family transporter [Alphaproteobacteria bacterium]|nr:EamA family transporter [Alphaproteobacteria bacterium]